MVKGIPDETKGISDTKKGILDLEKAGRIGNVIIKYKKINY